MAYETKDNTGSLFQNTEKRSENFPDYSGSMKIGGHDWWISGWRKTAKDGRPYLSLAFKPKDGTNLRPESPEQFKAAVKQVFDLNDEVPF